MPVTTNPLVHAERSASNLKLFAPPVDVDEMSAEGSMASMPTAPRLTTTGRSLGPVAVNVVGSAMVAVGLLWFARIGLMRRPTFYDEGILLSGADALRHGEVLYRDIYAVYPPGMFVAVAWLMSVFGPSYTVLRVAGLCVRLGIAVMSGRLAGRCSGRRFSVLGAGVSLVWLMSTLSIPFAWQTAMLLVLVLVELICRWAESLTKVRCGVLGAVVGLISFVRHDLAIFVVLVSATVALIYVLALRPRIAWKHELGRFTVAAGSALVTAGALWTPTIARAGWRTVYTDLITTQFRTVRAARALPLYNPLELVRHPLGMVAPAAFTTTTAGAYLLTLTVPILTLACALVAIRRGRPASLGILAVCVAGLASVPQLLQRVDGTHALFAVTPALILTAAGVESIGRSAAVRRSIAPVIVLIALVLPAWTEIRAATSPRSARSAQVGRFGIVTEPTAQRAKARAAAVAFLHDHSAPTERVFSGCAGRKFLANEMDLYFLADRRAATRLQQFDPGLQTDATVQRSMIAELSSSNVAAVVLADCPWDVEPNASRFAGSDLLVRWIASTMVEHRAPAGYRFFART